MRDLSNITVVMPDPEFIDMRDKQWIEEQWRSALGREIQGEFQGLCDRRKNLSHYIKEAKVILNSVAVHADALKERLENNLDDNACECVRFEEAEYIKDLIMKRIDDLNNQLKELDTREEVIRYFYEKLNTKESRGTSTNTSIRNVQSLFREFQLLQEKWYNGIGNV